MPELQFASKTRKKSTMARSLELLRSEGYLTDITESYNFFSKKRKDLFSIIDLVGIKDGEFLFVQTTTRPHMNERWEKIKRAPATVLLLSIPGIKVEIHGWHKVGNRWECERWDLDERHKG